MIFYGMSDQLEAEKDNYEAAASATSQEVTTAAARAEELEAALKAEKVKSEAAELNASVNSHEVETLTTKVKRLEGKLEKEKKEYVGYKDWVARRNIEINSKMHKLETALKAKVDKSEAAASATSEEVATAAVGAKKLEAALEEEKDKYELASLEATIAPNDTKMPDMELEELDHLRAQVSEMKRNGKDIRHSLPDLDHVPDVLLGKAKKYLRHRRFVDFKELHGERCFSGQ